MIKILALIVGPILLWQVDPIISVVVGLTNMHQYKKISDAYSQASAETELLVEQVLVNKVLIAVIGANTAGKMVANIVFHTWMWNPSRDFIIRQWDIVKMEGDKIVGLNRITKEKRTFMIEDIGNTAFMTVSKLKLEATRKLPDDTVKIMSAKLEEEPNQ